MPSSLQEALDAVRPLLLDTESLLRAVAAGRRRGAQPAHQRVELRPVDLKAGRHLQIVSTDELGPHTTNVAGAEAARAVDVLLAEPFGNWHVETTAETVQVRVTKKGEAQMHTAVRNAVAPVVTSTHDRVKQHLIDPADPLLHRLGADAAKRRQVDAFLRLLAPAARAALAHARQERRALHVVDLGCGNAYLTFAAHRYLTDLAAGSDAAGNDGTGSDETANDGTGSDETDGDRIDGDGTEPETGRTEVRTVGIDVRPQMATRNEEIARELGMAGLTFVAGTIAEADPGLDGVDLALALHACDTATDDALACAVRWNARAILAAPCCHHDLQRQIGEVPHPYGALTRHGILKERFADVLTDALRADILRLLGHRVDVVEFIDSAHTPRNAMIRAVRTGAPASERRRAEYDDLVAAWHVRPALAERLAAQLRT